jgi:membrane associated rhomboid family serine protease
MRRLYAKSNGLTVVARGFASKLFKNPYGRPLLGALILPVFIGFFEPELIRLVWRGVYWTALFSVPAIIFGVVYTWEDSDDGFLRALGRFVRPVPAGMICPTDLKPAGLPVVTIGLVLTNSVLFIITPAAIIDQLCFLPYSELDLPHVLLTTVTCAFLHGDFDHLFGNMIFLWAFGATLESRLGPRRYLVAYLLCSVISSLIGLNLLLSQIQTFDDPLLLFRCGSLGASGAISGLMGLFVVRCYFDRRSLSLPILFNPLFSRPLQVNGILLIGFFLAMDLAGNVRQMNDLNVTIDYWGHVGGFLGGLMLARAFNLQAVGAREARAVRVERLTRTVADNSEASDLYADMLAQDSENPAVLRHFLERYRYNEAKEGRCFARLVQALIHPDFQGAVRLVRDYYPRHLNRLSGEIQFRLGVDFYQNADFEKARLCLELAAVNGGVRQGKALLLLSRTYEMIGNAARAAAVLQKLLDLEPEDCFRRQATKRLMALRHDLRPFQALTTPT